jgi:hypothetical protein
LANALATLARPRGVGAATASATVSSTLPTTAPLSSLTNVSLEPEVVQDRELRAQLTSELKLLPSTLDVKLNQFRGGKLVELRG